MLTKFFRHKMFHLFCERIKVGAHDVMGIVAIASFMLCLISTEKANLHYVIAVNLFSRRGGGASLRLTT